MFQHAAILFLVATPFLRVLKSSIFSTLACAMVLTYSKKFPPTKLHELVSKLNVNIHIFISNGNSKLIISRLLP